MSFMSNIDKNGHSVYNKTFARGAIKHKISLHTKTFQGSSYERQFKPGI